MKPNNMVNQPVRPVVRAQSAGPTFDNGPSIMKEKGSKKTGWIFGIVLCLILAAGGIGFGVWAWMDGKTQVDDLNGKISTLKQQNDELQNQLNNEDGNDDEVDTADYIYVGEWGLKIKIPEGLNKVSYEFRQWKDAIEGNSIYVMGVVGEDLLDFANPGMNFAFLGTVSRIPVGSYEGAEYDEDFMDNPRDCGMGSVLVFSSDGYNYCYAHPQSVYSTDESEKNLEVESVDLIESMLKNTENYSKI